MKSIYKIVLMSMTILMFTNGCVSYMVMDGSKKNIAMRRAVAAGEDSAIKAIRLGDNGVGVGINVSNLAALGERPVLQLGAAIIDAAVLWGTYEGIKTLDNNNSNSRNRNRRESISIVGNNNDVIIINGNDNDSNGDDVVTN